MKLPDLAGLLVIDKPVGMMSRAAVDRAGGWFPRKTRIGHTGTLDPLASGVLVLCIGLATRLTEYVQRMPKVYRAGVTFGASSDTDDAEGTVTSVSVIQPPARAEVDRILCEFLGEVAQVPPAYSAAKVTGRRAYDLARRGEAVSLQARPVRIHTIYIISYAYPLLEMEVRCGKGTYIRSLARDLGERLGCGGLIEALRRTWVGPFGAEGALTPNADAATARAALLPLAAAVSGLPRVTLQASEIARLRLGQVIALSGIVVPKMIPEKAKEMAVFDTEGALIAIVEVDAVKHVLRPAKVLVVAE